MLSVTEMLPLRDQNPTSTPPHVTRAIIIINVIVFLLTWLPIFSSSEEIIPDYVLNYGMIPAFIMQGQRLYTVFTSMFLHGGIAHIAGNMLYLHIFGDNVEDAFGHKKYLAFYLICGIVAAFTHILATILTPTDLNIPTLGASGAISGVLGAYLVMYPRARILTLVFYFWITIIAVPAIILLGFWFIFQLLEGYLTLAFEVSSGTAYWAHIGGFVAGMALAPILKKAKKKTVGTYRI